MDLREMTDTYQAYNPEELERIRNYLSQLTPDQRRQELRAIQLHNQLMAEHWAQVILQVEAE